MRSQRGMVLLMVLWVIVLMTVLAASYVQSATTESLQSRYLLNVTQARYSAESGLHRAVYELRNPTQDLRWLGDGRVYEVDFEGAKVSIEIQDETGKVDLNAADDVMLTALFASAGLPDADAKQLAGAVQDWRDPDTLKHEPGAEIAEYEQADLNYGPRNRPFETLSELQQVLGMDFELFQQLEPSITLNSGSFQPNMAYAPASVLRLVPPGLSEGQVEAFLEQRLGAPRGAPLIMPNGQPVLAQGGGLTYTIRSTAVLSTGAKATLEATVMLGSGSTGQRPFRIVRWRDGGSS